MAWGRPSLAKEGGMLRNFSLVDAGGRVGGAGDEGIRTMLSAKGRAYDPNCESWRER
jgi:hypothetical protein